MARRLRATFAALVLIGAANLLLSAPAHALRLVNWNITNYPGANGAGREPYMRTVLGPLGADVMVVQEMQSQTGVNQFLNNVLNTLEPGQWAAAPFFNGNDTDNQLYYKPSKVQLLGAWAFYPNPASLLRFVSCYRLKPVGYASGDAELRIYSQHLKASQGFEAQRLAEATGIRDSMNAVPPGTHCILAGDYNIYVSTEPAFGKLLETQADNDGRLYDPLNAVGAWHDGAGFAPIHTQCPCLTCPVGSGFSGGGMDDRFDMFLPTLNMGDAVGLDLVPGSYRPVGNDGLHFNFNIIDPPTIPEGAAYANALWNASDHLPLRVDLRLPARNEAPTTLAFGNVIVDAVAEQTLSISNAAAAPAEPLAYSLGVPADFDAAAGPFAANAGDPANDHTVTMSTASTGIRSGTLAIDSNDLDAPSKRVSLSGTVLRHAAPSLDSAVVDTGATIDFGAQSGLVFTDQDLRVHNQGFDALQARLSLDSAAVLGGDGRFSLAGGFTTTLLGGVGKTYAIHFDATGSTPDSTYQALLTFHGSDEPLPGASPEPDLVVNLLATRLTGPAGIFDPTREAALRFYPPSPNPLERETFFAFDLPKEAPASLRIYDASGRRVASLASGTQPAGRHRVRWTATDQSGARVPTGIYFARFSTPGLTRVARVAVIQ